jgi:ribosomal protein S18 acetylase RimI-like enzyme
MKGEGHYAGTIHFRPITDGDRDFLYRVYASTRLDEMAMTGWSEAQVSTFLTMQFTLQHTQYRENYPGALFALILAETVPAGRLYTDRNNGDMRVIDITLLKEFRGRGIGGRIMRGLVEEADAKGLTMSLHVEMNNPARELYQALGFREKGLQGIHYSMEREVAAQR